MLIIINFIVFPVVVILVVILRINYAKSNSYITMWIGNFSRHSKLKLNFMNITTVGLLTEELFWTIRCFICNHICRCLDGKMPTVQQSANLTDKYRHRNSYSTFPFFSILQMIIDRGEQEQEQLFQLLVHLLWMRLCSAFSKENIFQPFETSHEKSHPTWNFYLMFRQVQAIFILNNIQRITLNFLNTFVHLILVRSKQSSTNPEKEADV